jgi:hypothetical protein
MQISDRFASEAMVVLDELPSPVTTAAIRRSPCHRSRTYTTGAVEVRFYSQRSGVPGLPSRPQLRRIAEINKGPILDTSMNISYHYLC